MPPFRSSLRLASAALCALTAACASGGGGGAPRAVGPTAQEAAALPMRLETVGHGRVAHTRTTDLWVFHGVDGRRYAYTGTWGGCRGCVGDRMYAWDVTDPAAPVLTDSVVVDAMAINDVAVNAEGTLAAIGRRGAESRRNGVVILDLADPAHPRPVGEYWETLTGGVQSVFWDGTRLYAVDVGAGELAILDASTPSEPRLLSRWGVPGAPERQLNDVVVRDGLAYLAYWDDGLVILDVGNGIKGGTPEAPRAVSQTRYRTRWMGDRWGATHFAFPHTNTAGRPYVFVTDALLPPDADLNRAVAMGGLLHAFDVRDPQVPLEVATYEVQDRGFNKLWAVGDTLFAATNNGGLRAVDISGDVRGRLARQELAVMSTADPQGFLPNLTFTVAVMPLDGLVFATDFNSGLWIARLVPGPR